MLDMWGICLYLHLFHSFSSVPEPYVWPWNVCIIGMHEFQCETNSGLINIPVPYAWACSLSPKDRAKSVPECHANEIKKISYRWHAEPRDWIESCDPERARFYASLTLLIPELSNQSQWVLKQGQSQGRWCCSEQIITARENTMRDLGMWLGRQDVNTQPRTHTHTHT